jgi:hypothetical protein
VLAATQCESFLLTLAAAARVSRQLQQCICSVWRLERACCQPLERHLVGRMLALIACAIVAFLTSSIPAP